MATSITGKVAPNKPKSPVRNCWICGRIGAYSPGNKLACYNHEGGPVTWSPNPTQRNYLNSTMVYNTWVVDLMEFPKNEWVRGHP